MEASETLPIVDAHQHFWDLSRNYHPWLCDPEPIPFRYGDYSRLKRSYMPADYRRDSAGFDIVKTVYVEAEWDPKTPLAETRWVEAVAADRARHPAQAGGGGAAAGRPPRRRRLDG